MCAISALVAGTVAATSVGGAVASNRAAERQADTIEDADERRSQETQAAIDTFSQNSPTVQLGERFSDSIVDNVAGLLGLTPSGTSATLTTQQRASDYLSTVDESTSYGGFVRSRPGGRVQPKAERVDAPASQLLYDAGPAPASQPRVAGQPNSQFDTLRNIPGYQFQFDEGLRSVRQHLSTTGSLYSGKALREITRYGQNVASTGYQRHLDNQFRALGAADSGQTAVLNASTGNAAQTFAATEAAAGHRNDGAASIISGVTGAVGGAASAFAPTTTPSVSKIPKAA